ncbi:hypothetical protein GW17_00037798 [Ensete ventricosum]|nr:hypothetical protein GW17_00037798 [Ensete ventricosum]
MHEVPMDSAVRGTQWPQQWPQRLENPPYWLNSSQIGVYGKPAPEDFKADFEHWKPVVSNSYLKGLGIDWSSGVRNVMDMRAVYGGSYITLLTNFVSRWEGLLLCRCELLPVIAEVDRILRPQGNLIVRDNAETIEEVESMARSLNWEVRMSYSKENEGLLCVQKTVWRPKEVEATVSSLS